MNWELINGITGIVSALCALLSTAYFLFQNKFANFPPKQSVSRLLDRMVAFLLACSGWILCCLSFLWVLEPYGSHPTDSEYRHFFGVMIVFPAVVIFIFGINLMRGNNLYRD